MRVVAQRSLKSSVSVDGNIIGSIESGLVLLVGFTDGDNESIIDYMVSKVLNLRIFDDEAGVMNKSVRDIEGEILSISQFTLYADTKKGNRPSYIKAMNGIEAKKLYDMFNDKLKSSGILVNTGQFGAEMIVSITNDGPITIMLEKENNND